MPKNKYPIITDCHEAVGVIEWGNDGAEFKRNIDHLSIEELLDCLIAVGSMGTVAMAEERLGELDGGR